MPDRHRALASELRVVLGQLSAACAPSTAFPLSHGTVLGRLEREGPLSVERPRGRRARAAAVDGADGGRARGGRARRAAARIRTTRRRALVELTEHGRTALHDDRRQREGWLAGVIADDLSAEEQEVLGEAAGLLRRIAESG